MTLWGDRMCCGSRVLGSGGRIAGNRRQNAGQPGAEWLVSVREKRATLGFARFYYLFCCLGHPAEGDQPAEGNNPAGRAGMWPTACAYLPVPTACADCLWPTAWANLPDAAKGRAGRGRGRLVELVLDEELDGLVFCHSEFVVEDCGVVVSLLCAEPEFSLV